MHLRVQPVALQAEKARIPYADGTLVATPGQPAPELVPSLLAASDVLGTGWFAAEAGPGKTVAVVGDGAVGLMGVLAARLLGAERIIAMSRHPDSHPAAALTRESAGHPGRRSRLRQSSSGAAWSAWPGVGSRSRLISGCRSAPSGAACLPCLGSVSCWSGMTSSSFLPRQAPAVSLIPTA